eukprot:scaffold18835_cov52-Attheya_sp.AAC.4
MKDSSFSLSLVVAIAVAVAASLGGATAWDLDKRCWKLLCRTSTKGKFDAKDLSRKFERWDRDACDCTDPGNKCSRNNRNLRHHNTSEPVLHEEEEEEFWTDMGLNEYDPEQAEERMLEEEQDEEEEEEVAQYREESQQKKQPKGIKDLPGKFKLRLWWYPLACWQMETRQREWCVSEEDKADKVAVKRCDRKKSDEWRFERIPGARAYVRIRKSGTKQCWEAFDRSKKETRFSISLKTCNFKKTAQHWKIDFDADIQFKKQHPQDDVKFEIQARDSFMKKKEPCCVSQGHHPRADERLDCQTCSKPRSLKHQSSFWEAI